MDTPRHKRFLFYLRRNAFRHLLIVGTIAVLSLGTTLALDLLDASPSLTLGSVVVWALATFLLGFVRIDLMQYKPDLKRRVGSVVIDYYMAVAMIAAFIFIV